MQVIEVNNTMMYDFYILKKTKKNQNDNNTNNVNNNINNINNNNTNMDRNVKVNYNEDKKVSDRIYA